MQMDNIVGLLGRHENLAGWAQFLGAMLALVITYFTAFAPVWERKKRLYAEANRLLMHGYEVVESYHRTSEHVPAINLGLRQASLGMSIAIEEMSRFPVYELDKNYGPMSFARRLMVMRAVVSVVKLYIDATAEEIGDREATPEEMITLRTLIETPLDLAHKVLMKQPMERPTWPYPQ